MTARPPRGGFVRVPVRGHRGLLLAAILGILPGGATAASLAVATPAALSKEKTEEEKLFEAIGAEWKAGDAKALAARFPEKRKVTLRLPDMEAGDYRAEQARSLLEKHFAARRFSKVELKSVKESTGTFEVEYVRDDKRKVTAELLLGLGTEEKKRVLVSARETS